MVDTGSHGNTEYIKGLQKALTDSCSTIQEIVLTHWHNDHVGGVKQVFSDVLNGINLYQWYKLVSMV